MSSSAFNKPLNLQFKPSKIIMMMIVVVHIFVATIIIFMTPLLPLPALFFLLIIISSSYYYFYLWHIVRRLDKSILELHINSSGDWSILTSTAKLSNVTPLDSSFSSQYLMIINFKAAHSGKYTLLIAQDMISGCEFRRLRVRLKTIQ